MAAPPRRWFSALVKCQPFRLVLFQLKVAKELLKTASEKLDECEGVSVENAEPEAMEEKPVPVMYQSESPLTLCEAKLTEVTGDLENLKVWSQLSGGCCCTSTGSLRPTSFTTAGRPPAYFFLLFGQKSAYFFQLL